MNEQEILRCVAGLKKKHGDSFSLAIKYLTNSGKIRKRSGLFVQLTDNVLTLRNKEKGGEGKYLLERIKNVAKSA